MQVLHDASEAGGVQRPYAALEEKNAQPVPLRGCDAAQEQEDGRGGVRVADQVGKGEFGEAWEV